MRYLLLLLLFWIRGQWTKAESEFEGSGLEIGKEPDWSFTPMNHLKWKLVQSYSRLSSKPIPKKYVLGRTFVLATTGLNKTKTEVHVSLDLKSLRKNDKIYRFSFEQDEIGQKSRLELTTCFTKTTDIIEKYNGIPAEIDWLLKTSCSVVHLPLQDVHTYSYEIYIPEKDFNIDGRYIFAQWHGVPDPTIIKDESGCVGQIPIQDLHKLCLKGICTNGEITNEEGHFLGLRYCQGGYPPLTFALRDRHFVVTARSDERVFMGKGGCPHSGTESTKCSDYPRQVVNVIWKFPAEDFKFDKWVKFKWQIKWSEYSSAANKYNNPGTRTTDGFIRMWINDEKMIDWTGPCGRNDNAKIPYFKTGIYNPMGHAGTVRLFFRRYKHRHEPMKNVTDNEMKEKANSLQICDTLPSEINQNVLGSKTKFVVVSSASKNQCTLYPTIDHLSYLRSVRNNRMLVDSLTRRVISNIINTLDDQAHKMKNLERKLENYELELSRHKNDDDYF